MINLILILVKLVPTANIAGYFTFIPNMSRCWGRSGTKVGITKTLRELGPIIIAMTICSQYLAIFVTYPILWQYVITVYICI